MSQTPVTMSFKQSPVYEIGARLLALLAYPMEKSEARLDEIHTSLCAKALQVRCLINPDDTTPIMVKPQDVVRETNLINRHTRMVARRLSERLVAARMAIPFFLKAELGRTPVL